ncbi:CynX/NimT family MFS transporter [Nocardioides terrisoli]|uniref:CynX/NimT family MFS transporter n=1 Tax=Nocardioides terrisoli TaxID=3388267 RepID=UPI00287B9E48|nr:MFS transporter [Nocardioides marmorisolisilvae]
MHEELDPARETRWQRILVVVGIVVLAVNLRPAAVSVGPVLDELSHGLHMSPIGAGLLTALPVLSFATVGALAPRLARSVGIHRLILLALVCVTAGLALRAQVHGGTLFLVLSFLGLSGMAAANVLLPSLVKAHFPDRIGLLTAVYSTALAIGLTGASVLTVPIATFHTHDVDWRRGIFVWAILAAAAAIPWLGLVRHDRAPADGGRPIRLAAVARTRLGWVMAVFFGLQSLQAYSVFGWAAQVYRDAGFSATTAGLLLGVITGMSIPLSYLIPSVAARMTHQSSIVVLLMACYPIGYLGLILAPHALAWLWAVVIGIGLCTFPLILTLIGLRARTPEGVAALSGWTQSVGYLIAVVGPFGVGALYDATGGWTVPLLVLLALCVPQFLVGMLAARPAYLEDQLA